MIKKQIRVIGIDDCSFDKFKDKEVIIIGTFFRGGEFLDGVMSRKVKVDGNDSTKKIIEMINKSKFKSQLRCIFLDGIAVAGFNVIDVKKLSEKTKLPVIVVIRYYPDVEKIKKTLKNLKMEKKIKLIEKAGEIHKAGKIYVQLMNIDLEEAKKILEICSTRSYIPEPIRTAHLIGAGISMGESKGRA